MQNTNRKSSENFPIKLSPNPEIVYTLFAFVIQPMSMKW